MRSSAIAVVVAGFVLSSCSLHMKHSAAETEHRIALDEPDHFFYPLTRPPSGSMSAQDAYAALLRNFGASPRTLPNNLTARYGLLTQNDTAPPSDRTPVWAFTQNIGCIVSTLGEQPMRKCVLWNFVRASDGRYLQVQDQQTVS